MLDHLKSLAVGVAVVALCCAFVFTLVRVPLVAEICAGLFIGALGLFACYLYGAAIRRAWRQP